MSHKNTPFIPANREEAGKILMGQVRGMLWAFYPSSPVGKGLDSSPSDVNEIFQWYVGLNSTAISAETQTMTSKEAIEAFEANYGYSQPKMIGSVDLATGTYSNDRDDDLYPVAECNADNFKIFFYAYGIIAVVEKNSTTPSSHIMRMD